MDLERTNPISSSSKWPGPAILDQLGDRYVSAGRGTACSPSQPRAVIEFNDNPQETDENLTSTVRSFADGKLSLLTLMLMAKDETDTVAWKRFDDDAVIRVTYVSKPATPAEHGFPSGSTQICSKSESAPTTISDLTPILVATPRAVSGGESGGMLRLYFDVDGKNPDGTWFDAPQPTTGSLAPTTGHLSYSTVAKDFPNQPKEWNVALKEGTLYRFTVNTQSYPNTSYTQPLSSGGASWCYFKVDPTAPKAPVVKFNSVYSECVTGGSCVPAGAPGQAGSFTFSPATGDSNTHYQYKLSTEAAWSGWKAATSGSYTTSITPPVSGTFVLNVQAKDSLGRVGEAAVKFLVSEGSGPVGRWDFNEASGVALDTSTTNTALQNNLTLTASGATRTEQGRRGELTAADGSKTQDRTLSLTSTAQGAASTTKQVVETQASYTMTAWARLDTAGSAYVTVLGQDSANTSAFFLSYCADVQTWCVRLAGQRVNALNPPQPKAWTHLGVVVNTTTQQIDFYVNGVPQGTKAYSTGALASTGGLQVGRAKYAGSYVDYFPGQLDEVAMWQRPLSPEEMAVEAGAKDAQDWGYVELVAQYNPAGGSGSSLQDTSGYSSTLTMASGASLNGEDIVLDGVDDSASTDRPLVDDTGSFTVSTAVDVDTKKLETMPTGSMQVLGQQTAAGSSWGIWFEKTGMENAEADAGGDDPVIDEETGEVIVKQVPVGRWHFGRLTSDGTGVSVRSEELLTPAGEIRLTGVFDATSQTIRLYVGGVQESVPLAYQSTVGSGFTVGKGWINSAWGSYLPGRISDIRLWAGALTNEQQLEAVVGN
ncbi:LamG domain-containing protein [Streptomyces sp. NBC_01353]|uniref:LamG domain-containing protein n=1 Tax=Streptomyces sp. NBC_01353 TaxID=2903835 RepID=UPI002E3261F3|nr:LamG domain-containing protein [Streptomyces sp. NBC_01353]